jgi:hypothetical protein
MTMEKPICLEALLYNLFLYSLQLKCKVVVKKALLVFDFDFGTKIGLLVS